MTSDVRIHLRLLWLPRSRPDIDTGFEVALLTSPYSPHECPAMEAWLSSTQEAPRHAEDLLVLSERDEPVPLPSTAEFVLMLSFTEGERAGAECVEQFLDWRALSETQAADTFSTCWTGEFYDAIRSASVLVQLPGQAVLH